MTDNMKMQLDGQEVSFTEGETVLEVARREGTFVPTLCWDERLDPYGSCRLCVVEVEGRRIPASSCTLEAEEGMVVRTDSDKLRKMQGTLVEMVLSENPGDECPRCRDIGTCEVHELAEQFDVGRDRFLGAISNASKEDSNPFLLRVSSTFPGIDP